MIEKLLREEVQAFIRAQAHADEQQLLLKHKTIFDIPASIIAWQISGKRKAKTKIPFYYNTPGIVYPPGLNLEQSSSEETARFKATILDSLPSKNLLADLSGGFGIDSFFLSQIFNRVLSIEPDASLIPYAKHNHQTLGAENISYVNTTAEQFLENHSGPVDCFFVDPSRRTTGNKKVFKLADCEPNVTELQPEIFSRASSLLIKTSPMLDVQQGIAGLTFVKHIWVVSADNEVKELLFLCERGFAGEPVVTAIDLKKESEALSFTFSEERNHLVQFSDPLVYLYEPGAALLKAGAFKTVAAKFALKKLHPSTHIYTHTKLIGNFPGRIFEVERILKADAKAMASVFPARKANIITRNYPLSPQQLKKKLKLEDGGEHYLIGCSGEKEKFLIGARRIK